MANQNGIADRDVVQYNRFGIAPALVMGLGTPTRFTFTYLHLSEYDHPDYGLPWLYSATAGATSAISRPPPLSLTQSNYYGFEHGNFLRTNVDVPTIKIEHDFNDSFTLTDQLRYGHYSRQFNITEPQNYTLASALRPGGTGTLMLQPPGTPFRHYHHFAQPARRQLSRDLSRQSARRDDAVQYRLCRSYPASRHRGRARNLGPDPLLQRSGLTV